MIQKRAIEPAMAEDLREKIVLLAGPRQVGKTTLARSLAGEAGVPHSYFNWDVRDDRRLIRSERFPPGPRLLIFDELHKFSGWKRFVKGIFDAHRPDYRLLVTGSARLDLYRRGGDSLLGRTRHYRLHPFSLAEVLDPASVSRRPPAPFQKLQFAEETPAGREALGTLWRFGGFPEPFLAQSERGWRRWGDDRLERLIRQDIRDVESLRDLNRVEILADLLPGKVGGLFSLNALREDLEATHKAVALWTDVLEKFYFLYRLRPFHPRVVKTLRKEPKLYLWDWSGVPDEGARLENLIGSHLLKFTHHLHDVDGHRAELYFLRDADQHEVDFLVTVDKRPWFAVEVKLSSAAPSSGLRYFSRRMKIPLLFQVVGANGVNVVQDGIHILSAAKFPTALV